MLACVAALAACGKSKGGGSQLGGESHFLGNCTQGCGALSCIAGIYELRRPQGEPRRAAAPEKAVSAAPSGSTTTAGGTTSATLPNPLAADASIASTDVRSWRPASTMLFSPTLPPRWLR